MSTVFDFSMNVGSTTTSVKEVAPYYFVFGYYTKAWNEKVVKYDENVFAKDDDDAINFAEKMLGHFGKETKAKHLFCKVVRRSDDLLIKVKHCDR